MLPTGAEAFSLLEPAKVAGTEAGLCSECCITTLRLDSRANCFLFDELAMRRLRHEVAATAILTPGTHLIRIKQVKFAPQTQREPSVLLWVLGGRFTNRKTEVEVGSTWSSLAGYDDVLNLEVKETALLCAFFLCKQEHGERVVGENQGDEITLSIVQLT